MFKSTALRLFHLFTAFALTLGSASAYADDTEIYFGGTTTLVPPNVLLILDTSGSMADPLSSGSKTKMEVMKGALIDVIKNANNVNMGLMRFTNDDGGPVLFPIAPIDAPVASVVSEPVPDTYSIITGEDDAEENRANGAVSLYDQVLETPQNLVSVFYKQKIFATHTPYINSASSYNNVDVSVNDALEYSPGTYQLAPIYNFNGFLNGFRFVGIGSDPGILPSPGDIIDNAVFKLWYGDTASGGTVHIYGHNVATSPVFPGGDGIYDISARLSNKTSSSINWNFSRAFPEQINVTPIVQEIVEQGCTPGPCIWDSSALTLLLDSRDTSVDRKFHSLDTANRDAVPDQAPELELQYTSLSKSTNQIVGLRFQNVNIPQGATITGAKLIVTPTAPDTSPTRWLIKGELSPDSSSFTATSNNLSNTTARPRTSRGVSWDLPPSTTTSPIASCDDGVCNTSGGYVLPKDLVQEIVNQSGWCGGNAMTFFIERERRRDGTRFIKSFDADPLAAARLEVSYDTSGIIAPDGCYRNTETAQLTSGNDDAEEANSGAVDRISPTLVLGPNEVGIRFTAVDVPQNANIVSAHITFAGAAVETSGTPGYVIHGEYSGNALQFESLKNNISNTTTRPRTTATGATPWNFNLNALNEKVTTPELKNIVQEIVTHPDWSSGNAMAFLIDTDSVKRTLYSFNGDPARAARLVIEYKATGGTKVKTVRDRLIELVNNFQPGGATPIVETMLEALFYWRGENVTYGKSRDGVATTRLSHPGSYCNAGNDCNGADTTNYPPYGVDEGTPAGCSTSNLNAFECVNRRIAGTPTYISPFSPTLTCQANFQVLLADGGADSNDAVTAIESKAGTCALTKSDGTITDGEKCGLEIADFLSNNDQDTTLPNDQLINTYTVGFDTASLTSETLFLKDLAAAGQGQFFESANATDLAVAFNTILSEVKTAPTSFVSPSLATNAFNRLLSRDEIYFGLFTPSFQQGWPGNVKKYNICVDTTDFDGDGNPDCVLGEILDDNRLPAIDDVTNKFKDTATSVWSNAPDGRATVKGGSGAEMTDYANRTIYTDATPTLVAPTKGTSLSTAGHKFDVTEGWDSTNLSHVRDLVCPVNSVDTATADGLDCQARMLWVLGKVFQTNTETDVTPGHTRWTFNDVLHSSPTVITYGGDDTDNDGIIETFYDKLIVGTNDGGLRFINGGTGLEEWTFIPQELLANQSILFTNPQGNHLYGLDTTPTIRIHDADKDGFIEPGSPDNDFVHVYVAMRRGGSSIYALDITPSAEVTSNGATITPKFLWRIDSTTPGFNRLTNTWSQPQLARIATATGDPLEVLIFGGGYDPRLDAAFGTAATGGADNLGNAIYIIDPNTGAKIMSISGDCGGCSDIEVAEMHYSIVSRITTMDSDGDGLVDRLYAGDTGGQVWRVDLGEDFKPSPLTLGNTIVGRLAAISTAGGTPPVDERRFFNPPAVVQVKDSIFSDAANGEYDYVLIGSGNRAHPLNKDVSDRFYAFRDKFIGPMPDVQDGSGTGTAANPKPDHLADTGYPQTAGPITQADMVDVSTTILDSTDTAHRGSLGWYFDFDTAVGTDGEKVLSAGTAIAGAVFFTTYVPDAGSVIDPCSANIGAGFAYDFNILSTRAALDWDEDGSLEDLDDRQKALGGGIPSDVVPVFTKEGVVGIVGIEGGASQLGTLTGLPRVNTYWYEES